MNKTNEPEDKPEVWVNADTVMKMLHISASTLKEYRRIGLLIWCQPNKGKIIYLLQSVHDLIDRNKRGGGGTPGLSVLYMFMTLGSLVA